MRKLAFFLILTTLVCVSKTGFSQKKIKYKDIWGLLSTKQYEAAEPFLKKYLAENNDNPNAYLHMGIIYQEKSLRGDVLKQTRRTIQQTDSAITFYQKAYSSITEKELKRNDEYYQAYNRRDLRTGEFGIKLSDVQYDIEKRIEMLRERADRIRMVKHYFVLADSLYKKCGEQYAAIDAKFADDKELFLRADSVLIDELSAMVTRYDSVVKAFDQYKASSTTLGKTGYNQKLTKEEIKSFKNDGKSGTDFYKDEVIIWDYKTWASNVRDAIVNEIIPIREHLIAYDVEINKLREHMNADSVSVKPDLSKLIDRLLLEKLSKYDERPLPMDVFKVKIADLEYRSLVIENKKLADSADVHLQLTIAKGELEKVTNLDSLTGDVLQRDFEKELRNYEHFVNNTYGNATVLRSFLKVMKDFSSREREKKQEALANAEEALRWMVLDESDSIPLFQVSAPMRFMPLSVEEEKFTIGLEYADSTSAQGYFYTITPTRKPDLKIKFPVDKPTFTRSRFPAAKTLAYSDPSGQVFYVLLFSEKPGKDNLYKATLAKIYRSDGLAWSSNYALKFIPKELTYRQDSGEFVIRADAGESVVDKNGKMLR